MRALIEKFQKDTEEIKTHQGILPICTSCKKIRDGKVHWNHIKKISGNIIKQSILTVSVQSVQKNLFGIFSINNFNKDHKKQVIFQSSFMKFNNRVRNGPDNYLVTINACHQPTLNDLAA
jgi:hypothetical protein